MMARETKVGLAVACSFLCLVGVVVFYKYRQPAPSRLVAEAPVSGIQPARLDLLGPMPEVTPPADGNSQAHPPERPAPSPPGAGAPAVVQHKQHEESPAAVEPPAENHAPPPSPPARPAPAGPDVSTAVAGKAAEAEKQPEHKGDDLPPPPPGPALVAAPETETGSGKHDHPNKDKKDKKDKKDQEEKETVVAAGPPAGDPPAEPPAPATGAGSDKHGQPNKDKKADPLPPPEAMGLQGNGHEGTPAGPTPPGVPGAAAIPPVPAEPPPSGAPAPPPPPAPGKDGGKPSEAVASGKDSAAPAPKPEEKAAPATTKEEGNLGAPPPPLPGEKIQTEQPSGHRESDAAGKKLDPAHAATEGTLTGAPKPAADTAAKPTPATDTSKPEAVGVSVAPGPGAGSPPGVAPTKAVAAPPVADDTPAGTQPSVPHLAPARPLPPLGAAPTSVAPAIVVSSPTGSGPPPPALIAPRVESFDEEVHTCQPADNFAQISKQYYKTEAYANALMMYNRNHGQASPSVQKDPPELKAGDTIFIPPTAILEKRHPTLIPGLTPLPAGPAAGVTAHSSPVPSVVQPAGPKYATYRVVNGNEGMFTIAQRALKDGMRWSEIARLNPTFNPSRPVPPNTILYLPADARVPPENAWQQ
jgi:hypothetical protein